MNFDFSKLQLLLPSFENSNSTISAIVISVLFAIAFYFAFKVLLEYCSIRKRIHFYSEKFKQFNGLETHAFLAKRRELANEAKQDKSQNGKSSWKGNGALWLEFDESLVSVKNDEQQRLYNVIDAAHFFNTQSLAEKLTENRLLAAVPGILTAVGVLGTFLGLSLGLGDFSNLTDNSSADEIKTAVFGMIGGAGIAFATSLYGVGLSLFFNFYEKLFERRVRQKISDLQNQIDFIFPRIVAEQTLSNIENHTENSRHTLAGLSEKIGDRMQEVMSGVASSISSEIVQAIIPAINRIVDSASNSSEKTLEHLIATFSDKIGSAGDEQRQALQQATTELSRIPEMLKGMIEQTQNQLTNGISQQQNQDEIRQQQLVEGFNGFMVELKNQFTEMATQNAKSVEQMQSHLQAQLDMQQLREQASQTFMSNQFTQFQESQDDTMAQIAKSLENFMQQLKITLQNLEQHSADTLQVLNDRLTQQAETAQQQAEAREQRANSANEKFMQQLGETLQQLEQHSAGTLQVLNDRLTQQAETAQQQAEAREQRANSANEQFMQKLGIILQNLEQHSSETMQGVNEHLAQQLENMEQKALVREQQANSANAQFISQVQQHIAQLNNQTEQTIQTMEARLIQRIENQLAQDKLRQAEITNLLEKQRVSQEQLLNVIHSASESQKQANSQLLTSLTAVTNGFKELTDRHQQAVNTIRQTSQNMQLSANQFSVLSENLKTAVSDFGTKLNSAMVMAQATAVHQDQSLKMFDQVNQHFSTASQAVAQSAENLTQAVENTEKGANEIRQSFHRFNQELAEHLNSLNEQVARLLSEYGQRVSNQTSARLNEWNEQTSQYTSTMKDAISTLSSVVDEIDSKVARR